MSQFNVKSSDHLDVVAVDYINQEHIPFPDNVLKVWNTSGNRRIALVFKD